jgi:hypothetical protein
MDVNALSNGRLEKFTDGRRDNKMYIFGMRLIHDARYSLAIQVRLSVAPTIQQSAPIGGARPKLAEKRSPKRVSAGRSTNPQNAII